MRKYVLSSLAALSAIAVGAMPAMAEPNFNPSGLVNSEWAIYGSQTCGRGGTARYEVGLRIEPSNQYDMVGTAEYQAYGKLIGITTLNGVRYAQIMIINEELSIKSFYVGWVPYNSMNWLDLECE